MQWSQRKKNVWHIIRQNSMKKHGRLKKNGKLVCWSASVAPPEFCVAMDIAMVYPETHAAGAGARKASMDLLEVADGKRLQH